ncbi:uncharacterized protein [Syngnathus scovelli]|uniref:uncharacterized protein isoform X2 n=1 Tax=Syngnathus scovelli TaxID=161590 RepID=UPI002110ABD0|nr:uncharacterized protein LOC125979912 isoform X2 [Syngnathus scovelli]
MFKKKKPSFKLEASAERPLLFFSGEGVGGFKNQKAKMFPMKKRHARTDSGASLEFTAVHSSSSLRCHSRFQGDTRKKRRGETKSAFPLAGFVGVAVFFFFFFFCGIVPLLAASRVLPRLAPLSLASLYARTHTHAGRPLAFTRISGKDVCGETSRPPSSTEEREEEEEEEEESGGRERERECVRTDPGGATRYHAGKMTKFRARPSHPPPAAGRPVGRGINGIPSGYEAGRAHALANEPYDWTSSTTAEAFMQIDEAAGQRHPCPLTSSGGLPKARSLPPSVHRRRSSLSRPDPFLPAEV